jgi:hypothetical protein
MSFKFITIVKNIWCKWFGHKVDIIQSTRINYVFCKRCGKYLGFLNERR